MCEVIIWESSEEGVFGYFVFCACICECEIVYVYCSVTISRCVRIVCVGIGKMEESSKCARMFITCIYSFA